MTVSNLILMLRERQTAMSFLPSHPIEDSENCLRDLTRGVTVGSHWLLCLQAVFHGNHPWTDEKTIFKGLQRRCFHILPWKCLSWNNSHITDIYLLDCGVSISPLSFQRKTNRGGKQRLVTLLCPRDPHIFKKLTHLSWTLLECKKHRVVQISSVNEELL